MKKILLSVLFLLGIGVPTVSQASWLGDLWDDVFSVGKAVVSTVVDFSINVADTIASTVGLGFINHSSDFEIRLAEYTGKNSCWFCGVLGDMFDIMNDIVSEICATLQPVFLTLLGLGLLFWLLFRVGKVVLDISMKADEALVKDVLMQIIKVMVATLLITFYVDVFDYLVSPLLQFGIGLGNEITTQNMEGRVSKAHRDGPNSEVKQSQSSLCPDLDKILANDQSREETGDKRVFTEEVKESFLCYVRVASSSLGAGMAVGSTAVHAWSEMNFLEKFRHMQLLAIGAIIFLSFFCLFVAFPLKLFDPLMNLTFVAAMFPLWVVLWAFPATKKYSEKAINLFTGVIIHLIVISIVSVISIKIMASALGSDAERQAMYQALMDGKRAAAVFEGVGETGWGAALGGFGLVGKATLMTAALGYFAFQVFKKTKDIADGFGADSINFGMNDAASSMVGKMSTATVNAGANVASAGWHSASEVANRNTTGGKIMRGALSIAGGPLGAAYAARRFQQSKAYTGSGMKDTLRTSALGSAVGSVFGRKTFAKMKDENGEYRLDSKTGKNTRVNKDESTVIYDKKSGSVTKYNAKGEQTMMVDGNGVMNTKNTTAKGGIAYNATYAANEDGTMRVTEYTKANGQKFSEKELALVEEDISNKLSDAKFVNKLQQMQAEASAEKAKFEQKLGEAKLA